LRIFFHLAYKGTKYRGWQKQANTEGCVQEILEAVLEKVCKQKISLVGCGRTDAGVHASDYYAHADFDSAESCEKVIESIDKINHTLPQDIVIYRIYKSELHARFNVVTRRYRYYLHFKRSPFLKDLSSYYPLINLDLGKISQACEIIKSQTHFHNFCKTPDRHESTICKIIECYFEYNEQDSTAILTIKANRFLKSMVRIIVQRILEIGKGEMSLDQLNLLFDINHKMLIHKIAHPQGLFLDEVIYTKWKDVNYTKNSN
jgi:tRNA pseudouridine38-40 synthase